MDYLASIRMAHAILCNPQLSDGEARKQAREYLTAVLALLEEATEEVEAEGQDE